jgi:hypothetical protein
MGGQDRCHVIFFSWVLYLNFNHVIITKDSHMVLHIMIGQNTKKINFQKNYILKKLHDVMLKYICAKNIYVATY